MSLSRNQMRKIIDTALGEARFGDIRVHVTATDSGNARFGDSMPTTGGQIGEVEVAVTAQTKEGRKATVKGSKTDKKALADLVRQAEDLADVAPVDPEHMPPLGKTKTPRVDAVDRNVVRMGAQERVEQVAAAIKAARKQNTDAAGFLRHSDRAEAHGDRAGLFAYHRGTSVGMSTTCRTEDASGSAKRGFASHAAAGLDGGALASEASTWAQRSKNPTPLDPGAYTVVLTPDAVADLMSFFTGALSHRRAVEGRSFFSEPGGGTKLGKKIFDPRITIWSDPTDREHPSSPLGSGGVPRERTVWVDGGVLTALRAGRWWAAQTGVPVRPRPGSLFMSGGTEDIETLIGSVDRGVLVSRFWYNRMLEPRTILATGLTRDGTFLIEKGKIERPVKNFRYNDSPVTLLRKVIALGKPERAGLGGYTVSVMPPMVVEGFNFESVSDAV